MVTNSEEIDLTLKLSLDKPHAENAEKLLTIPSSSISGDISKILVGSGASGGSSVSSLHKPCSLPLKAEKIEFQDLQTMRRPKDVKRLTLQKQNKLEEAKIKKEISPTVSLPPPLLAFDRLEVPYEVVARAAASVSKNPAFIRALAQIKEDLKLLQDFKHKSARGLAKGGATSRFLRSPKKEKDPTVKEEIPARPAESMLVNPLQKKVKLEHSCLLNYLEWSQ
ncbi:uncharacterized protein LOC114721863 [Neltuma alba]|uniref:uncharacterized protein LOC114721863 n=1 Tax=Neltuma alba TaxID=207710 RepID=UPI0010A50890|nr:uncharacterized protein LOC114721863 [Prosopis alba]